MYHGLNIPCNGSIPSLYNPLLLWVVWNNYLPLYSCLLEKTLELLGGIISPIV
jgi:hypothetical protein